MFCLALPFSESALICLFCLLFLLHLNEWYSLCLISVSFGRLTRNRCYLGAENLSIHCCIITLCHIVNLYWEACESGVTVSLHPRLKVGGPCVSRSVWHVQIHKIWRKECYDAKLATVTNSSTMCLTSLSLFFETVSLINLYSLKLARLCCGLKGSLPKSMR